jgi:hypothetical protein
MAEEKAEDIDVRPAKGIRPWRILLVLAAFAALAVIAWRVFAPGAFDPMALWQGEALWPTESVPSEAAKPEAAKPETAEPAEPSFESRPAPTPVPSAAAPAPQEGTPAVRITRLEERIAALEAAMAARLRASSHAAQALAIGRVRAALVTGAPFAIETQALEAAGAEPLSSLAVLREHAQGVPTEAQLRLDFALLPGAVLRAEDEETGGGWLEKIKKFFGRFVTVRRTGAIPGGEPEAVIARAEASATAARWPEAVAELEALSGGAREAAQPWLDKAQARLSVEKALNDIEGRLLQQLSRESAG